MTPAEHQVDTSSIPDSGNSLTSWLQRNKSFDNFGLKQKLDYSILPPIYWPK